MGQQRERTSNKRKNKQNYIEEKDRIRDCFEEICRYASSLGLELDEDNISWDNGYYALDIRHLGNSFRIENYKDGFVWLHLNTAGNGGYGKKTKFHVEGEFKSYHTLLKRLSQHHAPDKRCDTRANYKSRKMESLFDQIKK